MSQTIIGIYIDQEELHYIGVRRSVAGWNLVPLSSSLGSNGVLSGPGAGLKDFLRQLPHTGRYSFYLAMPGSRFFLRDIRFPAMPLEDALLAAQNSLGIVCHLPLNEIFHDILLVPGAGGQIHAMIVYAPKREMELWIDSFRDSGFENRLKGIFPFCAGLGAWMKFQKNPMPMALVIRGMTGMEVAVFQKKGLVASIPVSASGPAGDGDEADRIRAICRHHEVSEENLFGFGDPYADRRFPDTVPGRLKHFPPITANRALASVMPVIADRQEISIDGRPTRLKLFAWSKVVIPVAAAIIAAMTFLTVHATNTLSSREQIAGRLKEETRQLRQKLHPLEQKWEEQQKVKGFYTSMDEFLRTRPRMFTHINEIARLSPEGTWFSRFTFQGDEMTLQGQGADGLKVIEAIRASTQFEQVRLVGSVSRNQAGVEQFSVSIKINKEESTPP